MKEEINSVLLVKSEIQKQVMKYLKSKYGISFRKKIYYLQAGDKIISYYEWAYTKKHREIELRINKGFLHLDNWSRSDDILFHCELESIKPFDEITKNIDDVIINYLTPYQLRDYKLNTILE